MTTVTTSQFDAEGTLDWERPTFPYVMTASVDGETVEFSYPTMAEAVTVANRLMASVLSDGGTITNAHVTEWVYPPAEEVATVDALWEGLVISSVEVPLSTAGAVYDSLIAELSYNEASGGTSVRYIVGDDVIASTHIDHGVILDSFDNRPYSA